MSLRESLAVGSAPIFLRLALGITFLWAGVAKVVHRAEFTGADAAILANYGVVEGPSAAAMEPISWTPSALNGSQDGGQDEGQEERRPDNRQPDGSPPPPLNDDDLQDEAPAVRSQQGQFSPDQFAGPVKARALHGITLRLHNGMMPGMHADTGETTFPLWFDVDATQDFDPWPVRFAWAVAITELIAGGFLLLGLLTRLSALSIAGTMVGAIWLTTIGPAMQTGQTTLGFLPERNLLVYTDWAVPLWQFALLMSSIALFCAGSGAAAIDRLLFGNPFFYRPPARKNDD